MNHNPDLKTDEELEIANRNFDRFIKIQRTSMDIRYNHGWYFIACIVVFAIVILLIHATN